MKRKQRIVKLSAFAQRSALPAPGQSLALATAAARAVEERRLGNHQAAVDICNMILARNPSLAAVHHNRGVALQELKRYEEALASFDRAVALNPGLAEAFNNRGAVFQKLNRYAEALASYDQALALKPGYANAHHNRGLILKKTGRYAEALAAFSQALALGPDHADAFNNRGVTLQELKRYDEALADFDQTIVLRPAHAEAYNNRGIVLANLGRLQAAENSFRKACALKPDFTDPKFNLAHIRKYQNADHDDINRIRALLGQPGLAPGDQECLGFALGKIYDDCGRYDEAFAHYRLANQIRNTAVSYDADGVVRMTNRLMDVFSREFLARPFAFASDNPSPLFIVGMPRSGTTLMASILSNHPAIATAGELPAIIHFNPRMVAPAAPGHCHPQELLQLTHAEARRLIDDYERRLQRDQPSHKPRVIDKNPLNFWNLGFMAMLFPQAQIIHCTRHPLDTGLSNYFQRFPLNLDYSFELRNIGHFYAEYARLMEHWRRVLPRKMVEISYEDVILHTEPVVRQTLALLGVEWDSRCLAPHTNPCAVESASQWQVRQPIYRESLARWRHYEKHLTPLKEMLPRCGPIPM